MPLEQLIVAATRAELDRGLAGLGDLPTVGVDIERADWERYFRSPALVQIGGSGRVVVADPLAIDDFTALQTFLDGRLAVFHALENDLVPLEALDVTPPQAQDTAIAAALLGLPTGLGALLAEVLGVQLQADKQAMQRADWEARPLGEGMLAYAAADVADLPELWQALEERLRECGREDWYRQELEATMSAPPVEERRAWTRLKGVGRLDPKSKARVRALWTTREELARETDTAPGRIASDKVLVDLATRPPKDSGELGRRGMRRQAARRFGADLLSAMAGASTDDLPPRGDGRGPSEDDRKLADKLRAIRAARAAELGIDAGVLCPSRTLLGAILSDPSSPEELRAALDLRAWQWEQVGAAFCDALGMDGSAGSGDERTEGEQR